MSGHNDRILAEMGIKPLWRLRSDEPVAEEAVVEEAAIAVAVPAQSPALYKEPRPAIDHAVLPVSQPHAETVPELAMMDWPKLMESVRTCKRCDLCKRRKQAVLGVGDISADWLFVGEGPGAEEDERGEPFVGAAGKLLDAMLAAIGLNRSENVYIANAVKCRPPGNRTPETGEIEACRPYLERQIALIKPRLIVALGRPAAQTLLGSEIKIGAARGRLFHYGEIPVIVTYHPAYLLRNLDDKARAWEDLCFAQSQAANW